MKKGILLVLLSLLTAVVLIPFVLVKSCSPEKPPGESSFIRVEMKDGTVETMELEEYLVGVLAAEMPASFEIEALKAQAVAARTYALRSMVLQQEGRGQRHDEAHICTAVHCQAWISAEEMKHKWGIFNYLIYRNKLEDAVKSTAGLILTYRGKLIEPVYHSASGGRTENAEEVWGGSLPYLKSVESPWEEGDKFTDAQQLLPLAEVDAKLGTQLAKMTASQRQGAFKILSRTGSGRVKKVQVGDKTFAGGEFRLKLGLRSTAFTYKWQGNGLLFITQGNGHGVGLSQYGANGAAKAGKSFEEILKHYYTGVEISTLGPGNLLAQGKIQGED